MAVGMVAISGCAAWRVRATDGSVQPDMTAAVRASAAHDLSCTKEVVEVRNLSANGVYEFGAEGCGGRAAYRISTTEPHEAVLVSRSQSGPALP